MDQHAARVQDISRQVRGFYETKQKFRISHGSTNSTRNQALKEKKNVVDTSMLNSVLSVDTEKMVALVEPNVPMDRLVEATLEYNCIPPVIMDFPGITAGGGFAGTACESSSFKHGYFDRTVNRIEMVLPSGEIVNCSEESNADLFHGAAAALGTLGVVTLLEIRLEEAKKYVEVTYHPVTSIEEGVSKSKQLSSGADYEKYDYVDGILYSPTSGAIITGRRTNDKPPNTPIVRFSAPTDHWYAWHVQERSASTTGPVTELIPLPEYLFRYDRGGFWVGYSIFQASKPSWFTPRSRYWLDDFLHTRMLYSMMHSASINVMMVQDMAVPYSSATEFIEWSAEETKVWPLWLCPLKQSPAPTLHPHNPTKNDAGELEPMLNIGIWGAISPVTLERYVEVNQRLEAKLASVGGMKWMYGVNFQNDEDFWKQFDKEHYDALRKKYHAEWMPSIADKARTKPEDLQRRIDNMPFWEGLKITTLGPILSFWRAWKGGAWKEKRKSTWPEWVPRSSD